jgi:hypothetical protein
MAISIELQLHGEMSAWTAGGARIDRLEAERAQI